MTDQTTTPAEPVCKCSHKAETHNDDGCSTCQSDGLTILWRHGFIPAPTPAVSATDTAPGPDPAVRECPTCGPMGTELHPRLPVIRCGNCKEHLAALDQPAGEEQ